MCVPTGHALTRTEQSVHIYLSAASPSNLWVVCLSNESLESNEVLNKLSLHAERLKIQDTASLLEEQARTTARARGKRTTWLLLWDIIFEIDRCHQELSDDIIGGWGPRYLISLKKTKRVKIFTVKLVLVWECKDGL